MGLQLSGESVERKVHAKLKHGIVIKCPRCGYAPEDGERLRVKGVAERDDGRWVKVDGFVVWSYEGPYRFEGIEWSRLDVGSSEDERAQCTACDKWSPLNKWGFYDLDG